MKLYGRQRKKVRAKDSIHRPILRCIPRFEPLSPSTANRAIKFYRKYKILHVKGAREAKCIMNHAALCLMFKKFSKELEASYTIESKRLKSDLAISSVLSGIPLPSGSWYASSILQPTKGGKENDAEIAAFLENMLPINRPMLLQHAGNHTQCSPVWFFFGHNKPINSEDVCTNLLGRSLV